MGAIRLLLLDDGKRMGITVLQFRSANRSAHRGRGRQLEEGHEVAASERLECGDDEIGWVEIWPCTLVFDLKKAHCRGGNMRWNDEEDIYYTVLLLSSL